jgi:hypothetical protein
VRARPTATTRDGAATADVGALAERVAYYMCEFGEHGRPFARFTDEDEARYAVFALERLGHHVELRAAREG